MFIPLHDDNDIDHIRWPYVNYGLIAITTILFFVSGGVDTEIIQKAAFSYGLVPSLVNDLKELPAEFIDLPDSATFLTYAFLHANFLHLAGNMLFLWVFGDNIEDAVGHVRYLLFYLACAAGGGIAHVLMNQTSDAPLIGASGAVAGIVAAYLILHPKVKLWILVFGRIPLRLSAAYVLVGWAVYQIVSLVMSLSGETEVAWWAHIGGFIVGGLLILVVRRPGVPLFDKGISAA
ncbi:MAG: rhomboid family intramembrane serine protease [Alphaproteobacteria bacterium]